MATFALKSLIIVLACAAMAAGFVHLLVWVAVDHFHLPELGVIAVCGVSIPLWATFLWCLISWLFRKWVVGD